MRRRSKRYQVNHGRLQNAGPVSIEQGIEILKEFQPTQFDETVEIAIRTGIDPRQTAQAIRGAYSLPHGIGKSVRVIAFCEGELAQEAIEAGAIEAGGQELAKKVGDGWMEFEVAVAHPGMMRFVGKLGRILGPQGKMPSPKAGTVTQDIGRVVKEFVAGKIKFKNDAGAIIHAPMGKKSFSKEQLTENIQAFIEYVSTLRPPSAKGAFLRKVYLKTTMSPAVLVNSGV
ncbi:MAG: 50S ribosomal protein L1 [Planctomycetota bacterium]